MIRLDSVWIECELELPPPVEFVPYLWEGVVRPEKDGRQTQFALDREYLERRVEAVELDA